MKTSKDSNDIVTCEYCEYYNKNENDGKMDIFEANWGVCKKHKRKKWCKAEICDDFVIISGYHTPKWYPGKNEK